MKQVVEQVFDLVDSELRLQTNVVFQFEHQLVYAMKGEFLAQAVSTLSCGGALVAQITEQQTKPVLLFQAPNNAITLGIGELNKIIKNLARNAGVMNQQLFDKFKVLLRMEAGCQVQLPNGQVVNIFGPTKGFKCPETWQQSMIRQINTLVRYIRNDLGFKAPHILAIVLSLLLVSWSVIDLCNIYEECKIKDDLTEADKRECFELLNSVEAILIKICDELKFRFNVRLNELLKALVLETTKLISKIDRTNEEIKERIKILKEQEFNRTMALNIFAAVSGIIGMFTYMNWGSLSTSNRTVGIIGGGATTGGAIAMAISVNRLMQAQRKQEEVLNNMENLNAQLSDIQFYASGLEYEPSDHVVILRQFEGYLTSLQHFQTQFR
ncbi:4801_t:CDS:2 [Ambispora gerdemannii]|uniref:4801_t:CDS:1 n=1 Tax=Ambispora gerdemannii TaxID=144530 RepID=A0A9N9FZ91_9GLOM|nr:4801_t:CDS:2 [Ambispora gerdemannii]